MKKIIPIGVSDFKKLIEGNYFFVDKSLIIKEFINNGADIILTPRPRRFGKTLNLSMLKYFFDIKMKQDFENNKLQNECEDLEQIDIEADNRPTDTRILFDNLNIEKEEDIMKLQGKYPTIFLTFKNEKYQCYEDFKDGITLLLSNLYKEHDYLLESDKLSVFDKEDYRSMISRNVSIAYLSNAISMLMGYMNKHYGKKVMLFIDEYDVPIQEAYIKGYYDEMISLIRTMLTSALKDNPYVQKALITGILRVAKESIFSGLNNLEVDTILGYNFNDKFGFTPEEVEELLDYYDASTELNNIREWYNGYVFREQIIYNPWSVLNYLKRRNEGFMPYWINSSSNDLIKKLLVKGDQYMKLELESLIEGKSITKGIDDNIVMSEVENSNENIWSFLLMSGYLKAVKTENIRGRLYCELKIPNEEVLIFYENLIEKWFLETLTNQKYELMLNTLITGDIKVFAGLFKDFVINNLSYFDVSGKEPERVYHAFVLGMLVSLSDNYKVKSNKESGYGRYDVMIIPKDTSKIGIIIEFKKIDDFLDDTIEEATRDALKQIEDKKYAQELIENGIKNIIKLAIVFKGKTVEVTM
ncbi:AAA family ATPase [Clostridium chromiireducens]|uniref:AAA family ATPase n=1 Tax=Clostridium chromiireducens TaxID=225345 RepID=A0A964RJ97_9CLOT|nr:AAA family ATPase [Clostridium chromiireducens]MVX62520.1 AAA family ATPase [Clostridium chromiireducens]